MFIKGIVDEDFVNYKVPSMFISMPVCTFKCDIEAKRKVCQNSKLERGRTVEVDDILLVERFAKNPITKAIVFGGLEPFDTYNDIAHFITEMNLRNVPGEIVIYSGYTEQEVLPLIDFFRFQCRSYRDLVVKYGRFIPDMPSRYDDVLGVRLASINQYAVRYEQGGA